MSAGAAASGCNCTPSSRVRSVVNALRSLYRWAQDRELAGHNPAELVRLPAMDATPRDRVATPDGFTAWLAPLPIEDALPDALAAYGTARHQQIRTLDWSHVDLKLGAVELAADEEGRKPGGSWQVVPLVKPLSAMLRRAWIAQGRPTQGKVCPPKRDSASGLLDVSFVQKRVHERWTQLGLEPIGLHESRHTAATWLDHAGVSPKVASTLMGHRTPEYQPRAASVTLRRYTHTLPGELERARDLLDAYLAKRAKSRKAKARRRRFVPRGVPRGRGFARQAARRARSGSLENRCAGNRTEGSNPSPSASEAPRNPPTERARVVSVVSHRTTDGAGAGAVERRYSAQMGRVRSRTHGQSPLVTGVAP